MDVIEALRIITALSDGVNPETGEMPDNESALNSPRIIRALFLAKEALETLQKSEEKKSKLPQNAGKPWTKQESQELISNFDLGCGVTELSLKHARTKGAIAARLVRLGKITERSDIYQRKRT